MDGQSVHHSSQADVWHLKQIFFTSRPVKIITQNFNGPCSFIAICNILILRGQIEILPPDRTTVSYEFLSQLVGEYLLTSCPDVDVSAALSIMPSTTKGLDLNPQFTSITAFSPTSDAGELSLFAQAGIQLVHGWVVDPESSEAEVMSHIRDYDTAVTLIADADYITHGRLLGGGNESNKKSIDGEGQGGGARREGYAEAGPSNAVPGPSLGTRQSDPYSDDQRSKIEHAVVAQQFLDATKSQLTYHGLFQLASTIQPGSLVALFRNAHLSVVYKSPEGGPGPGPGPGAITPQPVRDSGSDPDTDCDTNTPAVPTADTDPAPTDAGTNPTPPQPAFRDSALYALVTDDVFLHEQSIVWERLEDVDGDSSWFVDSDFHRAIPVGGDVAGQTAEGALRRLELVAGVVVDPVDQALARQMQAEEDARAHELYKRRQQSLERRRAEEERGRRETVTKPSGKLKKSKNCVIM